MGPPFFDLPLTIIFSIIIPQFQKDRILIQTLPLPEAGADGWTCVYPCVLVL